MNPLFRAIVIDDEPAARRLMKNLLEEHIEIVEVIDEAGNGGEAIRKIEELKPDLITLDNILPDMIGTDILKVLKQDEGIDSKVIMISAVGQESVIQEGMSLGASDYIVKPFTTEGLVCTVNKVMTA